MHACLLHGVDLLDRAHELALERLQVIDLVLELRDAELVVVEDLEALLAAWQSLRREVQPGLVHLAGWHEDGRALLSFLHLVLDLLLLELGRYLACVLRLHIRKERHHVRLAAIPYADADDGDQHGEDRAEHDVALLLAVFMPKLQITLFPICFFCFVCHVLNPFALLSCVVRRLPLIPASA